MTQNYSVRLHVLQFVIPDLLAAFEMFLSVFASHPANTRVPGSSPLYRYQFNPFFLYDLRWQVFDDGLL